MLHALVYNVGEVQDNYGIKGGVMYTVNECDWRMSPCPEYARAHRLRMYLLHRSHTALRVFGVVRRRCDLVLSLLQICRLPDQPLLLLPHGVKYSCAVELRGGEGDVQDGRRDLEGYFPSVPELSEEVHCDDGLADSADECRQTGCAEEVGEEVAGVRIHAIQDDGDMWQEFANHVKCTYACEF